MYQTNNNYYNNYESSQNQQSQYYPPSSSSIPINFSQQTPSFMKRYSEDVKRTKTQMSHYNQPMNVQNKKTDFGFLHRSQSDGVNNNNVNSF